MIRSKYYEYFRTSLKPFGEIMQSQYYDTMDGLCLKARAQIERIRKMEQKKQQFPYITQCENIIAEIENHVKTRKEVYIPYIGQLSEKAVHNHDCSSCSGSCRINHDMHTLELNATNTEMKTVLSRLQMIAFPLYSETNFPDEYRLLRSDMTLIETDLAELFFIEDNYLIPKIIDAQKQINAGNK